MNKLLPWLISAVLAITVISLHVHYTKIVAAKDLEIQAADEKNSLLVAQANNKLKEAGEKVNAANEKLKQVANEAREKMQALSQEANEKIQAANQPEPTVSVNFRKALLNSGGVATLKSTAPQTIALTVVATRPATSQQKQFDLVVDSGQVKEIGEREGWAFLSGDTLKISQPSHKSVSYTVR
jgi:hypothetical protein